MGHDKKKFFSIVRNISGFTLMELTITAGLSALILGGVGMLFVDISRMQTEVRVHAGLATMAGRLRAAI